MFRHLFFCLFRKINLPRTPSKRTKNGQHLFRVSTIPYYLEPRLHTSTISNQLDKCESVRLQKLLNFSYLSLPFLTFWALTFAYMDNKLTDKLSTTDITTYWADRT